MHSCWLIQDLLDFFKINKSEVKLLIHRPSSAETTEIKGTLEQHYKAEMTKIELSKNYRFKNNPNMLKLDKIYSINKSVVSKAYISADSKTLFSEIKPNSYCTLKTDNRAFELLIDDLSLFVRYGRSQQFNMRNYYKTKDIYIDKYITHI